MAASGWVAQSLGDVMAGGTGKRWDKEHLGEGFGDLHTPLS